MSAALNYNDADYSHGQDGSGVHEMPRSVRDIISQKEHDFELATLDVEFDARIRTLVEGVRSSSGSSQEGPLHFFVKSLNQMREFIFADGPRCFNTDMVNNALTSVFNDTMNQVTREWEKKFAPAGADWNNVCGALGEHMGRIASLFGLEQNMKGAIGQWFADYQKNYTRDRLNNEALQAHQTLAYLGSQGRGHEPVVQQIRARIAEIERELGPYRSVLDQTNSPAFSMLNRQNDAYLSPENRELVEAKRAQQYQSGPVRMTQGQQHAPTQVAPVASAFVPSSVPTRKPKPSEEVTVLNQRPPSADGKSSNGGFWKNMKRGLGWK